MGNSKSIQSRSLSEKNKFGINENYFQNIDRVETELRIYFSDNKPGVFVFRPSSDGEIALSLMTGATKVKHFRIKTQKNPKGTSFFISKSEIFGSVDELVSHYKKSCQLGCLLTDPLKHCQTTPFSKNFMINYKEFKFPVAVGDGNFGVVFRAIWDKSPVALKKVKNNNVDTKLFLNEAKIMHQLDHKNLVKLLGVSSNNDSIVLVLEYMERGQLRDLLRDDYGKTISVNILAHIAQQVTSGMIYLEQMNLIHRDLRAENILISDTFVCKIGDFGLSIQTDHLDSKNVKFPLKWTAVEALSNLMFSIQTDVWSFGVLLWEMITFGETPYHGMDKLDLSRFLKSGNRLTIPENVPLAIPNEWYDRIMIKCWAEDPNLRPTFKCIEEYFSGWEKEVYLYP